MAPKLLCAPSLIWLQYHQAKDTSLRQERSGAQDAFVAKVAAAQNRTLQWPGLGLSSAACGGFREQGGLHTHPR